MTTASAAPEVRRGRFGRIGRGLGLLPRAAWACFLVATLNALCWAAITPTFWVPDEPAHAGYAQFVAERGELPSLSTNTDALRVPGAGEEQATVYGKLPFGVEGKPSWLASDDGLMTRRLEEEGVGRSNVGQALNTSASPPLYYALEAIPYRIAYNANYLDRIFAMRAFSALFAGLTALFVFLFLRQALPGRPWAWTVGSLAVAFQPVMGFVSGGINNDALIYATSAATLWGLARAFRRGLTVGTGALIGATLAVGLLTKLTTLALLPGVAVGVLVLLRRGWRERRMPAIAGTATLGLATAIPYGAWLLANSLVAERSSAPAGGIVSGSTSGGLDAFRDQLGYLWQSVLPRLPFMNDQFPYYPPWEVYFKGFIGRFGWNQYGFPSGWYWVALAIFAVIVALAATALVRHRAALRPRVGELVTYAALFLGVLFAVELAAYRYQLGLGVTFEQARYLFPALALYGALIAVAAIGAGPKWGRPVGAFLIVLAMGHSLFSQLLTLARFYA